MSGVGMPCESVGVPASSALFLSAFFDGLISCGVRDVVISPGSRSTPLSMVAYASSLNLYVDVDERGAAFFALGLAKASGRPVCLICTSGTAIANYYPAVLEAESSRVPLLILTGDRPPRLQNLGAPQTCDQLNAYGNHVKHFQQMPLVSATDSSIAFARQMALEAYLHATGSTVSQLAGAAALVSNGILREAAPGSFSPTSSSLRCGCAGDAGPVHFNFPFDEPLKPDLNVEGLFEIGRGQLGYAFPAIIDPVATLDSYQVASIQSLMQGRRTVVLAGEGSCACLAEARELVAWAQRFSLPLLADPLSGLRSIDDPLVIDNADNIFGRCDYSDIECVIRFGRYPISKNCCTALRTQDPLQIVVDAVDTRDFNSATDVFVRCTPIDFVRSFSVELPALTCDDSQSFTSAETKKGATLRSNQQSHDGESAEVSRQQGQETEPAWCPDQQVQKNGSKVAGESGQQEFLRQWIRYNDVETARIRAVSSVREGFEGAYVAKVLELAPAESLVFSGNSMIIRALDTFYSKTNKDLTVLCNRGLNGIDGTVSSALGAAQSFRQTTLLAGDLTMLHDLNALALNRELLVHHGGEEAASIIIILLNNNGGAIFDTLPQKSEDSYFERLFLTPQQVDFSPAAQTFGVPYRCAKTVGELAESYQSFLGVPGISLIEVPVALENVSKRYEPFQ